MEFLDDFDKRLNAMTADEYETALRVMAEALKTTRMT